MVRLVRVVEVVQDVQIVQVVQVVKGQAYRVLGGQGARPQGPRG